MLATQNRLRTSADFSATVRSGVRNGRRNLVLYTANIDSGLPSKIGFIVSKGVGNSVVRNLVKRRLRETAAITVKEHGTGLNIVVRALPAAAAASWQELSADYNAALTHTLRRLANPSASNSGGFSKSPRNEGKQHD
ncbi:ribonuclease P protein component [Pseudarthrobacter sp. J1738]|uniref:ribonuclease P protein component n=1 Tax=unclassified Pseudarthrobacter TaxID=2647000 RepID=UPI003D2A7316